MLYKTKEKLALLNQTKLPVKQLIIDILEVFNLDADEVIERIKKKYLVEIEEKTIKTRNYDLFRD